MMNGKHKMPDGHMMKDSEMRSMMGGKGGKKGYSKKSGGRKGGKK